MEISTLRKSAKAMLSGIVFCGASIAANANSVTYYLDQSNLNFSPYVDGTGTFATVTIDDNGGTINFTVDINNSLFSPVSGAHVGIDGFYFNSAIGLPSSPNAAWPNLPTGFSATYNDNTSPPPQNGDGFGDFSVAVGIANANNIAQNRLASLQFSIDVTGDTIDTYQLLSTGAATEGNAYFAVHISGFTTGVGQGGCSPIDGTTCTEITSGWFGGSSTIPPSEIPVPPAVWLFGTGLLGMMGIARRKKGLN